MIIESMNQLELELMKGESLIDCCCCCSVAFSGGQAEGAEAGGEGDGEEVGA